MTAEIVRLQTKQEAKFMCSACGEDRACDCNAPAVEKLAAQRELTRQRVAKHRKKKNEQKQQSSNVTEGQQVFDSPQEAHEEEADHARGLHVIAALSVANRAAETKELSSLLRKLEPSDITEEMIQAAEGAATAWSAMARNLRRMKHG